MRMGRCLNASAVMHYIRQKLEKLNEFSSQKLPAFYEILISHPARMAEPRAKIARFPPENGNPIVNINKDSMQSLIKGCVGAFFFCCCVSSLAADDMACCCVNSD